MLYTFTCAADGKKYKATEMQIIEMYSQKENGVPNTFYPVKLLKAVKVLEVGEPLYRASKPVNTTAQIPDQNSNQSHHKLEYKKNNSLIKAIGLKVNTLKIFEP